MNQHMGEPMTYEEYEKEERRRHRLSVCTFVGGTIGVVGSTIATIWGGYELGSLINDTLNLSNSFGRGTMDLVTMAVISRPIYSTGWAAGIIAGKITGALYHPVIEKIKPPIKKRFAKLKK